MSNREVLRIERLYSPQRDLPGRRGLSVDFGRLEEFHGRSQIASGASCPTRAEISEVHDRESLNRSQARVVMGQHFMTGLIHESLRQCIDVYLFVEIACIDQMTSHCADGVDESGRAILVVVGPKAFFEVDFAEQHVDRMYPSEVQVE